MLIPRHILAVLLLLFTVRSAAAAEAPAAATAGPGPGPGSDLVLIFDASGSMWGQLQGENKIVIARRVVGKLIDGLPEATRVGLIAYGHRDKTDCADIETVVPIGPLDRAALKATVAKLDPKGKTPITDAFRRAIETARSGDGTTVVLISDGLETCSGDPCKAVREAKAAGVKFVLHIIGFDVAKEDVSSLECAAQAGGGLYVSAANADELGAALDAAVALPAELPASRLSIKVVANGQLQDALVRVRDAKTQQDAGQGRTYTQETTNPRIVPLPAGVYDVDVQAVGLLGDIRRRFAAIEIGEGETVQREVDFTSGELAVGVTRNGQLSDATVRVRVASQREEVASGRTYTAAASNPKVFQLTAGTYDVDLGSVEIDGGPKHTFTAVAVEPGGRAERNFALTSGVLSVGVRRGAKPVDAVVAVLAAGGREQIASTRTYTSDKTNPHAFTLAPGQYRITISEIRGAKRELTASVEAGQTTAHVIDLDQP